MTLLATRIDADEITGSALLNCVIREVCGPARQTWQAGPHLVFRLPRAGVTLRAVLSRPQVVSPRLSGPVEELRCEMGAEWTPIGWGRLADLIAGELELTTGTANSEFLAQVKASHTAVETILRTRVPREDPFLASEQALVAGHRFHPAPKARQGGEWTSYAPEVGVEFPLHWLEVPDELIVSEGDTSLLNRLGPPTRPGHTALPAHPWQLSLVRPKGIVDLGPYGPPAVPTSSVRTVYLPDAFLKFSLNVRITNCLRKNAWYELSGAVALTRALRPVFDTLPGTLLTEPGYRTVDGLAEDLGVIIRTGVRDLPGTPLLAAAIADPYGCSPAAACLLLRDHSPEALLAWWDAYVGQVVPTVLRAYLEHGVVLEPHLQNVLICVDDEGLPIQAVFRDLEGTKLLPTHWAALLESLPARVAEALAYDAERGWNRVVYCLFVNHLAEVAAAVADLHPPLERTLWRTVRRHVAAFDDASGRVRALLAGVPFLAKANLRTRWARDADREATYVPVTNPLAEPPI